MTSPALSGVVYGSLNGTGLVHLPLEEMRVDALIVDSMQPDFLFMRWNLRRALQFPCGSY